MRLAARSAGSISGRNDFGTPLLRIPPFSAVARGLARPHPRVSLATTVQTIGLPDVVTCDRDSRFVGGTHAEDAPSPFVRFWLCLGVTVTILPPRRPDLNAFVERYHRSYEEECLQVYRPADLEAVKTVTARFLHHYNEERPHQGRSCNNQPPLKAFPTLPPRLRQRCTWRRILRSPASCSTRFMQRCSPACMSVRSAQPLRRLSLRHTSRTRPLPSPRRPLSTCWRPACWSIPSTIWFGSTRGFARWRMARWIGWVWPWRKRRCSAWGRACSTTKMSRSSGKCGRA